MLGELVALGLDPAANPDRLCGDFRDLGRLAGIVRRLAPDVIVSAAALTPVDKAEA